MTTYEIITIIIIISSRSSAATGSRASHGTWPSFLIYWSADRSRGPRVAAFG